MEIARLGMHVGREQRDFAAMVGAEARDDMLDIMRQRGLAQVEGQVIDHLDFAVEDVEFIAGIDHEIIAAPRPACPARNP